MEMVTRPLSSTSEGFGWRCTNQRCPKRHTYRTMRTGSFFEKSRVPLGKWLYIIYLWSHQTKVSTTVKQVEIGEKTVIQMYQYLCDVCTTKLLNTPIQLGGQDVVVQIDASLFKYKSKYNRDRRPQKELWVFGLADTSYKPAITYLEIVEKRDAATLLPIIRKFRHEDKHFEGCFLSNQILTNDESLNYHHPSWTSQSPLRLTTWILKKTFYWKPADFHCTRPFSRPWLEPTDRCRTSGLLKGLR